MRGNLKTLNGIFWVLLSVLCAGCEEMLEPAPLRSALESGFDRGVVAIATARRLQKKSSIENREEKSKESSSSSENPRNVVYVYGSRSGCLPCGIFLKWWEGLREEDRELLPIQFEYQDQEIPDYARSWGRPAFHWEGQKGEWWVSEGWSGIDNFLKVYRSVF